MSGSTLPIVVAGGGIAGLAAALALAHAGHSVTVLEKRADAGEAGAGLQLSPNASHILLRWGLGSALASKAVAPQELVVRRWNDERPIARMPFESAADGAPFWVLLRTDLHATLRQAAVDAGVEIHDATSVETLRQTDDGMILGAKRNSQDIAITTQCLIGADGQRSMVRRLMGDARDLDVPGWEAWRALIPAERVAAAERAAATSLWLGRDSHAVHYPVAAGRSVNLVVIRRSRSHAEGWSRAGDRRDLASPVSAAALPLRDLIDAAPEWAVWTLRDRAPSPYIAKGAAALVGDAAHPVLPFLAQGAAMAIEDAAVLAHHFPRPDRLARFEIEAGLSAYARARAGRVNAVFKAARANAFAYHLPAPLAFARDLRMRQLGSNGMARRYDWLYGWRAPVDKG